MGGLATSWALLGMKLKEMASTGQSSMHSKQTKHSLLRSWVCGSEAPWQFFRQASQSMQVFGSRSILQKEKRESTPRNAPSGQTARQKKRGTKTFMTTKKSRMPPMSQAPT
jgi:hypothetical protein